MPALLVLFAALATPACFNDKGEESTAGATEAATGDASMSSGTAPITSSNPTTGDAPTSDPTSPGEGTDGETTATSAMTTATSMATTTNPDDAQLCMNLGGYGGVQALVGDFVGRVLLDERINAYFLSTDVEIGRAHV